jgi:NTP pyrophosphatase (non-canonical NTP hydrolase)
MSKNFVDVLNLARHNVKTNPAVISGDTEEMANRYLDGVQEEVDEVRSEIKRSNEIYLRDELSDIAWDYACTLALLEERGMLEDAEAVLNHAHEKYTERSPAFSYTDDELWDTIKAKQKQTLAARHQEKYGKE